MQNLRRALIEARRDLAKLDAEQLMEARYQRWMAYGKFKEAVKR